jgi:plastocyanin
MRKGMWSFAAVVVLSVVLGPAVRAADEVTMGSESEPNAFKFFPAEKSVPVGTTVTWRNLSDLQHDVKAVNNSFASPLLDKGQTFAFKFDVPGPVTYYCTVSGHREAGMEATVNVTGGSTPSTAAPTTTTAAPAPGATTTTAKGAAPSATTTTRPGAGDGGAPTTTTTAGLGATSTTQAAATTPTSAPETGDVTTTTEGHGGEETAATDHGSEGGSDKKTNPLAVGLAGILTAALAAISLKLLTGKP